MSIGYCSQMILGSTIIKVHLITSPVRGAVMRNKNTGTIRLCGKVKMQADYSKRLTNFFEGDVLLMSPRAAGIAWWCPTLPRARRRLSCGRETWCLSIRREKMAGTKAPCRGRARRACSPAASSRASELEKVDK